jgi:hypothetical protein
MLAHELPMLTLFSFGIVTAQKKEIAALHNFAYLGSSGKSWATDLGCRDELEDAKNEVEDHEHP